MFDSLIQSNLEFINKLKISKFLKYFLICFFGICLLVFLAWVTYYSIELRPNASVNNANLLSGTGKIINTGTGISSQSWTITNVQISDFLNLRKALLGSIDFLSKNYKDIFYAVFLLSITLIVIEPPTDHREFIKRLYGQVLEQMKSDRYKDLSKNVFAITNKEWTWIKFLIQDVTERIHFEIYVMDFSGEIDETNTFIKTIDKKTGVYFQYALHVENLSKWEVDDVKGRLSSYFQVYNILPNVWTMWSIISSINEWEKDKKLSISYNLLSNLYKQKLGFKNEDEFYEADKVRKRLFEIFNEKKEDGSYKWEQHYTSLKDLSKADVKIIANTFLEQMNYFFFRKGFYKSLKEVSEKIT